MKKTTILLVAATAIMALTTACNKSKEETKAPAAKTTATALQDGMKVAYVDLDTLQNHYKFFTETKEALEAKSKGYEESISRLSRELENAAASFQQNLQNGKYTSEDQARKEQEKLVNKQNNVQRKQMEYAEALQKEQDAFNKALHDSINNFIADCNKTHNYTMILSKAGDNILYADPALDITQDVLAGLNKRYKSKKK